MLLIKTHFVCRPFGGGKRPIAYPVENNHGRTGNKSAKTQRDDG